MKYKAIFTIAILFIPISLMLLVDLGVMLISKDAPLQSLKSKTWAHAGYYEKTDYSPNSIESISNAFKNGAVGSEIDVFYDVESGDYIVSHNFPYLKPNGEILVLDSIFSKFGNSNYYWLDYKNLKELNEDETLLSIKRLNEILETNEIDKNRILIESTDLNNLKYFTARTFYTSWWINPSESNSTSFIRNYRYKWYYLTGKFSSLSMSYNYYARIEKTVHSIPINLWTINDKNTYKKIINADEVKIILTDRNWFEN